MHCAGTLNSGFFENPENWVAAKSCVPAESLYTDFFWDMRFCYRLQIRGVFWCAPIFFLSEQTECDVHRFGISDLASLSRSPRRPGSGVRARNIMVFWRFFVANIAWKCTLAKRNGRGVVYDISGNLKNIIHFISENNLEKNKKIYHKKRFRVHTPLLGLSWAICGKPLILEIFHDFWKIFRIF